MVRVTVNIEHLFRLNVEVEVQRSPILASHDFFGDRLFGSYVAVARFNNLE
jgi:hypothetical protein